MTSFLWSVSTWQLITSLKFQGCHFHRRFQQSFLAVTSSAAMQSITPTFAPSLNTEQFSKTLNLIGIKISSRLCNEVSSKFKNDLFVRPRLKRVYDVEGEPDKRIILLSEQVTDLSLTNLPASFKNYLNSIDYAIVQYPLQLDYGTLSADEVLSSILPADIEIPSSFEQVGHIAHLNLRELLLPYKNIIGQVIVDKNAAIKTVVNKIGSIETEFRTFPMEVIAGPADFDVVVKESGAKFSFNFKEVYWNSRLQMEHSRLIDFIKSAASVTSSSTPGLLSAKDSNKVKSSSPTSSSNLGSRTLFEDIAVASKGKIGATLQPNSKCVVADMMAGVGPFAVPLAMTPNSTIVVYANDLNPSSYQYLKVNAFNNKCNHNIRCYNMDGRDFILGLVPHDVMPTEVIMNLPASATEFLDVFIGYSTRYHQHRLQKQQQKQQCHQSAILFENERVNIPLPRIHVYGFSTSDDPVQDMIQKAATALDCSPNLIFVDSSKNRNSLRPCKKRKRLLAPDTCAAPERLTIEACNDREVYENSAGSAATRAPAHASTCEHQEYVDTITPEAKNIVDSSDKLHAEDEKCGFAHIVRDVSPNKVMVCLSFYLPPQVALAPPVITVQRASERECN